VIGREGLVARPTSPNPNLRDGGLRRRRIDDLVDLPDLLGRQRMWRAASPAMGRTSPDRPRRTVISVSRSECRLDGRHALAVGRPRLAVALATLVAEERTPASLAGHAADELLPGEPIVLGPRDIG